MVPKIFYSYSDSANFYSRRVSGAQQLPNGNILICSGFQGRLFEIDYQTDSVVWDYIVPVNVSGPLVQGQPPFGNFVFRAERFSTSFPAFNVLNIEVDSVLEINPLPSVCQITPSGCNEPAITGLYIDGIIDDRVNANFDNMNTYDANGNQICRVDQIRIQYRPVGTSAWSAKNIASPVGYNSSGICNSTQNTMKPVRNLTLDTEYEWRGRYGIVVVVTEVG